MFCFSYICIDINSILQQFFSARVSYAEFAKFLEFFLEQKKRLSFFLRAVFLGYLIKFYPRKCFASKRRRLDRGQCQCLSICQSKDV